MMAICVTLAVLCSLVQLNYGSLPEISESNVYVEDALYNRTYKSTTRDWADPEIKCGINVNVTYEVKFTWIPPHKTLDDEHTKTETHDQQNPPSSTKKFTKVGEDAVGAWTCVIAKAGDDTSNISKQVTLSSYPQIKAMDRSKNVVEGESVELECISWGYPLAIISWRQYPEDGSIDHAVELNATDRIHITSNYSGYEMKSKLHIVDSVLADRSYYVCVASSTVDGGKHEAAFATLVRVKSHLAPLWPFLGILAEIFVLAAIIGGYELYRRRQKTDGDDKDATPNQQPEDARKKK